MEDLNHALDAGIQKGVWTPTTFNAYGTPVVPVRKALLPGAQKAKLHICGGLLCYRKPSVGEASPSHADARRPDAETEWWVLLLKGRSGGSLQLDPTGT